uniref:LHLC1946 n=1 Tax=Homo sapiens TaxID=9606 RepID=Q6UXS3_HUMAN|nr:LHLC1946 [Homo sapiens]
MLHLCMCALLVLLGEVVTALVHVRSHCFFSLQFLSCSFGPYVVVAPASPPFSLPFFLLFPTPFSTWGVVLRGPVLSVDCGEAEPILSSCLSLVMPCPHLCFHSLSHSG